MGGRVDRDKNMLGCRTAVGQRGRRRGRREGRLHRDVGGGIDDSGGFLLGCTKRCSSTRRTRQEWEKMHKISDWRVQKWSFYFVSARTKNGFVRELQIYRLDVIYTVTMQKIIAVTKNSSYYKWKCDVCHICRVI